MNRQTDKQKTDQTKNITSFFGGGNKVDMCRRLFANACIGSYLQTHGAETENVHRVKVLVTPDETTHLSLELREFFRDIVQR